MEIKLFRPYVSWRAIYYVLKVLIKGTQLAQGPLVTQFEYEFGKKFDKQNVVAVNSGTSALELAYELAGIGRDDDVLTCVLTCTATNIPLVRRGARLIFADIDYDLNISIEDVKKKITDKTKAIVFVHFGGNNRGLAELLTICRERGIILIEDAAQAVGSAFWGQADFTCVSLQAIKTLTAGDGGVLLCRNQADYEKAKRLRWFGYDRDLKHKLGDTDLTEAGYKYHMNDINAAIGLGNLRSLDHVLEHRKHLAAVYAQYWITAHAWLAVGSTGSREYADLKTMFKTAGVEIGQHHYRNDKYTLFKEFKNDCPVMDELEQSYFFLPYHHKVTVEQAHMIGTLYANKK